MDPFVGQITVFPYDFPPYGWMDCIGQLLPISQYSALFSLLGTNYGGNGTSNFALPDLRGRVPVGFGQSRVGTIYDIGEQAGATNVTLLANELGSHSHTLPAQNAPGTSNQPANAVLATPTAGGPGANRALIYNAATPTTALTPRSIAPAGGNQQHNNLQPYLGLRFCIAISGVFPPRS